MKLTLNIEPDKPTKNNRIYSRKVLEEALDQKKEFFVVPEADDVENFIIPIHKIIAVTTSFEFTRKNEIVCDVNPIDNYISKDLFENFNPKLSPISVGSIKDNKVENLKIIGFYLDINEEN